MNVVVGVLLLVTTFFDGWPLPCVIDTGSPLTLLTRSAAHEVQHALRPFEQTATVRTLAGEALTGQWYAARHVGTTTMGWAEATVLVVPDDAMTAYRCVLGTNLLAQQPLVVDWEAREVRTALDGL